MLKFAGGGGGGEENEPFDALAVNLFEVILPL